MFSLVLQLAIIVIIFGSMYKIFEKAGLEGIKGLIPIYNAFIFITVIGKIAKLGDIELGNEKDGIKIGALLILVPFVNIYLMYLASVNVAKSFGKTNEFAIGMVLLPMVFLPLLAFTDVKYSN